MATKKKMRRQVNDVSILNTWRLLFEISKSKTYINYFTYSFRILVFLLPLESDETSSYVLKYDVCCKQRLFLTGAPVRYSTAFVYIQVRGV